MQASHWDAQLDKMRLDILPHNQYVKQAANDYQFRLDATFDGGHQDPASRLSELQSSKAYQGWSHAQKSTFLLLRGEARCLTHFCWFSPLVLRLFQDLRLAGETVAFHCCQVVDSSERGDGFISVLNHLTLQILETMPRALNSTSTKSIRNKINEPKWGKDVTLALKVLAEAISALASVILIIDRADLMRVDWEECISTMCLLASPRVTQGCIVKIILVGSGLNSDWSDPKEKMVGIVGEERTFEVYCSESDWNP